MGKLNSIKSESIHEIAAKVFGTMRIERTYQC